MMELRAEKISQDFLRYSAKDGYFIAVQETDFRLAAGTLTVVTGRSGSGKSTLLHILGGLMKPVTGRVLVDDLDLYAMGEDARTRLRSRCIGIAPQRLMSLAALTVRENILLPALLTGQQETAAVRADVLMERLGIRKLASVAPSELSGGELRRVTIARALVMQPGILLADEPTGDLDEENTRSVLSLLRETADAGTAVLLVTHEREAAAYADAAYTMTAGKLDKIA
ncbi:ABC transporter ATP-binding protein [Selenomonas sp. oral taxon 138]|uniref:ABC transporter ATP-binding protein n=1 Tax=Selenomonas sp. oral taxon 138 TaxID=712532 RepID=UPI0002A271F9|nr:ATP-binding cassette domain-containing protein [Selenomonas sp. oral taxon 138]EKX99269.1 ABC transporter, ATP-binding protein [Selenomonas sp. oral taxon 138 str. F0429]